MGTDQMSEVIQHLCRTVLVRGQASRTDGQLLGDYLSRQDEAALSALVLRHGPMVWGVCRRLLGNPHDAEDAFQATFLVLVRKAAAIGRREMVANWLYGVARQTALKARQAAARRRARESQVMDMPEPEALPQDQDLCRDLRPLLDEGLSRLPDKYRAALVLCDLEGKSRKEAARQLGLPEGTVGSRLARARALLARRLARHGLAVSGGTLAAVLPRQAASASVPPLLLSSTVKAAGLRAAGLAPPGLVSVQAAALTEGVLKAMFVNKLKAMVVALLVLGLLAFGGGLLARNGSAAPQGEGTKALAEAHQGNGATPPRDRKAPPLGKTDLQELQGTWRAVSGERYGEQPPEADLQAVVSQLVFTPRTAFPGNTVTWQKGNGDRTEMGFTIHPNQTPKAIDFGRTRKGIYQLSGDTLKLCIHQPWLGSGDKGYPTKMAGTGPRRFLIVFRRVKESRQPEPDKAKVGNKAASETGSKGQTVVGSPLGVTVTLPKNRVRVHERFQIRVRVLNSSRSRQSFQVMNGSWEMHWKPSNERVHWVPRAVFKNFAETVTLDPGQSYEKAGDVFLAPGKPLKGVAFTMGFTPLGSKQTYWSNEVTLRVDPE
jgi:RNA polymerase sigma factor (sigma-70 family)